MKLKIQIFLTGIIIFWSGSLKSQSGKYITFDGSTQYMKIPFSADFNFSTSQEYTISYWMYANAYAANARFVSKRPATGSTGDLSGYEMWGSTSDTNFFAVNTPYPTSGNAFSQWSTITGGLGRWIHMALVISRTSGTVITMYQDGRIAKQSTNNPSTYAVTSNADVLVGKGNAGGAYFNGRMDNLRFYNRALSQVEIQTDMTSTVTAATPNLVAAYDFEAYDGVIAKDVTGRHNANLVNFPAAGVNYTIKQDANFTGRGNDNEPVLQLAYSVSGQSSILNSLVFNTAGTSDISDIENIKIYSTGSVAKFDPRNVSQAQLLGTFTPSSSDIIFNGDVPLNAGSTNLWLTYKIKSGAKEGNKVDAVLKSMVIDGVSKDITNGNPVGSREILLKRVLTFAPGDDGSANYRIPAICTAADGSLVVLIDKRKNGAGDLPADIDLVSKRSTDGGLTWSAPVTVAKGTGNGAGYGDALLIKAKSGKLIALFVGGPGLFQSTPTNPIRAYKSVSGDNGITWSVPQDITNQLYGAFCTNPERSAWYAAFFGSGQGLTLRDGRIMGVIAVRESGQNTVLNNYAVYSDDEGETWNVSGKAISGGDEAKVVELNNGNIMMSVRGITRLANVSADRGVTWGTQYPLSQLTGNPTNGDIVRYTSVKDGYDKNRILHTIPNAADNTRSKVTMFVSYDEGQTWGTKKILCPGSSAYSSITILPDGTIGVYQEEDETVPYKIYFLNFSLDWLTNGADTFVASNLAVSDGAQKQSALKLSSTVVKPGSQISILGPRKIFKTELLDSAGRSIKTNFKSANLNVFTVPQVSVGLYFLLITTDKGIVTEKIIVN